MCARCEVQLAGQKFASREDKPYCADCFGEVSNEDGDNDDDDYINNDDQVFAKRCAACSKPITGQGGTRFISFEGRHWHSDCFVCALCKQSMAGKVSGGYFGKLILIVFLMLQGFITDGDDIICPECAKDKLLANS